MTDQKQDKEPVSTPEVDTGFMKEKIKARPVNRKKLLRRTLTTACLAALFGAVACAVFLVLEPVISERLNPTPKKEPIAFPEEVVEKEMSPEEMIADDDQITEQKKEEAVNEVVSQLDIDAEAIKREIKADIQEDITGTGVYEKNYTALSEVALEAARSMVTVTGVTPDYDWAGDAFVNARKSSGVIVAATSDAYLILAQSKRLNTYSSLNVTFVDDTVAEATIQAQDIITNLAVLSVKASDVPEETRKEITVASLGSSARTDLLGKPVIAIGSPSGTAGSVSYGIVTNAALPVDVADSNYKQITTDIYGSTQASGVLTDIAGKVIGWIDLSHNTSDSPNLISALGISELKPLVECLSNESGLATIGVHGTDVPENIHDELGVPYGAYVMRADMGSAAMDAGIQSGDIITGFGSREVTAWSDLIDAFGDTRLSRNGIVVSVKRQGVDGYDEIALRVVPNDRIKTDVEKSQ